MNADKPAAFQLGEWRVDPVSGRLEGNGRTIALEPKVMDLLLLLARRRGGVVSREEIFAAVWPEAIVGEDSLAGAVSKLRKALGDDPKAPRYVETLAKRGYRLIAESGAAGEPSEPAAATRRRASWLIAAIALPAIAACAALVLFFGSNLRSTPAGHQADTERLTARADDYYMRFTRSDNEAAIALYERVISADPSFAPAQAGLANALVQRVVRWQNPPSENAPGADSLTEALAAGLTETPPARELLSRAQALAERAVRLSPAESSSWKALGLVYSAQGNLLRASDAYKRAIEEDPNAWAALINLGEVFDMRGDNARALDYFLRAYTAMEAAYDEEPQRVGPWHAPLGALIGAHYEESGEPQEAEIWYRRVLSVAPYEPGATAGLVRILTARGDTAEAARLCEAIAARIGETAGCASLLRAAASAG